VLDTANYVNRTDHEEGLPDTESDTREDAFEQAQWAVFGDNMAEDLDHGKMRLLRVGTSLHLDAGNLKRVIPAR
jgi:hypothetical protein